MTKSQLIEVLKKYHKGEIYIHQVLTAVDAYSSASNGANPIVSGALPPKTEIESVLRDLHDDTLAKWSSHLEVDAGISEYASQIIELFRRQ